MPLRKMLTRIAISSLLPVILLFFGACNDDQRTDILGNWKMVVVLQDGNDVSAEHNPNNDRFIELGSDGTFQSKGGEFGKNSGKYLRDGIDSTLVLDSDAGEDDDSRWKVRFSGDTMKWTGTGTVWAERFEIWHVPTPKDND